MSGWEHWIPVEGEERVSQFVEPPTLKAMQEFCGGHIEHVSVLYEGRRASMYVHEEGALIPLPINEAATKIYWAAAASRGVDLADKEQREAHSKAFWKDRGVDHEQVFNLNPRPEDPPYIHGPAVVITEDIGLTQR